MGILGAWLAAGASEPPRATQHPAWPKRADSNATPNPGNATRPASHVSYGNASEAAQCSCAPVVCCPEQRRVGRGSRTANQHEWMVKWAKWKRCGAGRKLRTLPHGPCSNLQSFARTSSSFVRGGLIRKFWAATVGGPVVVPGGPSGFGSPSWRISGSTTRGQT